MTPITSRAAPRLNRLASTGLAAVAIALLVIPPALRAADDAAGFQPLFNGANLDGWHGAVESYAVEADGVVASLPDKGGNLCTDREYANFTLRFEFRLTPGGNNGIGLRVPKGGHASTQGMEIQILDDGDERYAKLKPYQAHGSVYGIIPAKKGSLKPTGEWNQMEIRCIGRKITVISNGQTIVDGDLDEATKDGTPDEKDHPGAHRTSGHICFCGHKSRVEFRNMQIREE